MVARIFSEAYPYTQESPNDREDNGEIMDSNIHKEPGMATRAAYQITIIGKLPDFWEAWFSGTTTHEEQDPAGSIHTHMTCRGIDQAELLGILIRLNNLNLPLLQVNLQE
jgi:hypothetical protein